MDKKTIATKKICVYGIVQGVGFRPFVSRAATKSGIKGSVCNKGSYVEIIAQGMESSLNEFRKLLKTTAPERSAILKIIEMDFESEVFEAFEIIESSKETGAIFVSPDIAICKKCQEELYDPQDRRYLHPFINCTACGPRLTILDSMPYDRERTSMGEFPMCEECNYEYTHAETRRYDAQPVCCNECGPEVYLIGEKEKGRAAITKTRRIIASGGIVAIKGIGGFHLCCDATNEKTVKRLREIKPRPDKPFAVMAHNLDVVRRECILTDEMCQVLDGHQKPIILLEKLKGGKVAPSVAPENPKLGVMLPYAPLQLLIFKYDDDVIMPDILVMTSANVSGAPICRDDKDAINEIQYMCDAILSHNRLIRLRADDTVMDYYENAPYMIRRSRGYAPLPFMMSGRVKGHVLGIGGELKNTFCIGRDDLFYPSPYIGDMKDVRTVKALEESVKRMTELLETKPDIIVSDLHPKYNTVILAEEMAKKMDIPLLKIQHHYAHIISCMAENDFHGNVIGVAFDGTGYGTDGTVWGGEILQVNYLDFKRLGAIDSFLQIGGDISVREGWRIAASMMQQSKIDLEKALNQLNILKFCNEQELKLIYTMAEKNVNSISSTSAGRLFDSVSALLGIKSFSTFESQGAMALQFEAEKYLKNSMKSIENIVGEIDKNNLIDKKLFINDNLNNENLFRLHTNKLFEALLYQRISGVNIQKLAFEFHKTLSAMVVEACKIASKKSGLDTVALSGGVFQNRLFLSLCDKALKRAGFKVLRHSMIPANDGGICLGQAVAGMTHISRIF